MGKPRNPGGDSGATQADVFFDFWSRLGAGSGASAEDGVLEEVWSGFLWQFLEKFLEEQQ